MTAPSSTARSRASSSSTNGRVARRSTAVAGVTTRPSASDVASSTTVAGPPRSPSGGASRSRRAAWPNGSGKTTLLEALLGSRPLTAGTRWIGPGVVLGRLEQDRAALSGARTVLDVLRDELGEETARTLLAKFGLGAEDVLRATSSLSPGERTRAGLALLTARGVNCLVLDEPTNHLDVEAIEELERALADYDGTVLLVTPDRRFLAAFAAGRTIEL